MAKKEEMAKKRARGGSVKGKKVDITPRDQQDMKDADDTTPDFKRGGKVKKRASGGRVGSHSPYSSARKLTSRSSGNPGRE